MRLKHYDKLAARWEHVANSWQGSWFIYDVESELNLERLAGLIALCYRGMAAGRRTRYAVLDRLKVEYRWHDDEYAGHVADLRRDGWICAACDELVTPPWELPEGERPCGC